MKAYIVITLCIFFLLTSCAENSVIVDRSGDSEYVEIDNPAFTLSQNATAIIWVPRNSVEEGVPRGSEVLKRGYDYMVNDTKGSPQQGLSENGQSGPDNNPREQYRENQFR